MRRIYNLVLALQFCAAAAAAAEMPFTCERSEVRNFTRYDSALLREKWRQDRWVVVYPRPKQTTPGEGLLSAIDLDAVLAAPGAAGERLMRALDRRLCRPRPDGSTLQWKAFLQREVGGGGTAWLTLYAMQRIDGVPVRGNGYGCNANFNRKGKLLNLRCNLLRANVARLAPGEWPKPEDVRKASEKAYLSDLRNLPGPGQRITSIERVYNGETPNLLAHHAGCGTTVVNGRTGQARYSGCFSYDIERPLHGATPPLESLSVIDGLAPGFEPRQVAAVGEDGKLLVAGYTPQEWTSADGVKHARGTLLLMLDNKDSIVWQATTEGGDWFFPRDDRILLWQKHEGNARDSVEARALWLAGDNGELLEEALTLPLRRPAHILPDTSGQRLYIVENVADELHQLRAVSLAGDELWRAGLPRGAFVYDLGLDTEDGVALLLSRRREGRLEKFLLGFGRDGGSRWQTELPPDLPDAELMGIRDGTAYLQSMSPGADTRGHATLWQIDVASGNVRHEQYVPRAEAYRLPPQGGIVFMGGRGHWALAGGIGPGTPWRRYVGFGESFQSFTDVALLPGGMMALVARVGFKHESAQTSGGFGIARLALPESGAPPRPPGCPLVSENDLRTLELALWRDHHLYLSPELYDYQPNLSCIDAHRQNYLDFLKTLHGELTRLDYRAPGYFASVQVEPGQPGVRFRGGGFGRGGHWNLQRSFSLRAQFSDAKTLAAYLHDRLLPHARRIDFLRQQFTTWTDVPLSLSYFRPDGPSRLPTMETTLQRLVQVAQSSPPLTYPDFTRFGASPPLEVRDAELALSRFGRHHQLTPLKIEELTESRLLERIRRLHTRMGLHFEESCNRRSGESDANWQLQRAMHCNDLAGMRQALRKGANLNARDGDAAQTRPIHKSATASTEAYTLLVDAGADPLARDIYGNTVLHRAAAEGARSSLGRMAQDSRLVNAKAHDGATPLHRAVFEPGYPAPLLAPLVAAQRDIDARTVEGETALHLATHSPDLVELLLEAGANPNARDSRGQTPLHRAAATWLASDSLRTLLAAGADPALKNEAGLTALEIARGARLPANIAVLSETVEQ